MLKENKNKLDDCPDIMKKVPQIPFRITRFQSVENVRFEWKFGPVIFQIRFRVSPDAPWAIILQRCSEAPNAWHGACDANKKKKKIFMMLRPHSHYWSNSKIIEGVRADLYNTHFPVKTCGEYNPLRSYALPIFPRYKTFHTWGRIYH